MGAGGAERCAAGAGGGGAALRTGAGGAGVLLAPNSPPPPLLLLLLLPLRRERCGERMDIDTTPNGDSNLADINIMIDCASTRTTNNIPRRSPI